MLPDMITTETGRAMSERRMAFLHLFLQELQLELVEGGYSHAELEDRIFNEVR